MPRTRASSVMSDVVRPTQMVESDATSHRLRSRKNINYMTPPLDDDSFQEKPELEPVRLEYKEYRELRSSTRALAVSFFWVVAWGTFIFRPATNLISHFLFILLE